jgi:hypothetical protein
LAPKPSPARRKFKVGILVTIFGHF